MESYDELRFQIKVDKALERIKTLLHNARNPQYPTEVLHQYDDKYLLVDFLTNSALAGQMNCLQELGVVDWGTLKAWSEKRSVTIRFTAHEHCTFLKKKKRKEESPALVTESKYSFGTFAKKEKIVNTFTDYIWTISVSYEIFLFQGNNPEEKMVLRTRSGTTKFITFSEEPPKPVDRIISHDTNITWLLQNLSPEHELSFSINRKDKNCNTPRRNSDIDAALEFFTNFYVWSGEISEYFKNGVVPLLDDKNIDLAKLDDAGIFVPVLPLYDETAKGQLSLPYVYCTLKRCSSTSSTPATTTTTTEVADGVAPRPGPIIVLPSTSRGLNSPVLLIEDLNHFLEEQTKNFSEKREEFAKIFPLNKKGTNIITFNEAAILAAVHNSMNIAQTFADSVDYIEEMMRQQLITAIGKEVSPADFADYMKYHNRKIFKEAYQPHAFSYAVRQPNHYPEGNFGIDLRPDNGTISEPLHTIVSKRERVSTPMKFSINGTTQVPFYGDRYLHAFVRQEFSGTTGSSLELVARARQFSCYILMVGRLLSSEVFDPKYAIIVSNKDEIRIPLPLETIPSAQEFKDAIESLSPEQQAIRSMQLASTLFAICVLEIKPQAEKLLKLPSDSLIKEIELTQDLLEMFIKYQIPSDLLTYDGNPSVATSSKVQTVKMYAKKIRDMIQSQKQAEIDEENKKAMIEKRKMEKAEKRRLHAERKAQRAVVRERRAQDRLLVTSCGQWSAKDEMMECKKSAPMRRMDAPLKSKKKSAAPPRKKMASHSRPAANFSVSGSVAPAPLASALPPAQAASPAPAPAPVPVPAVEQAPVQTPDQTSTPEAPKVQELVKNMQLESEEEVEDEVDYTKIPEELDAKFEALDTEGTLRPTIINIGNTWQKKYQKDLFTPVVETTLTPTEQELERHRAFDLIDILSKSGNLAFEQAALHVVIASTHCFDKTLTNTVIMENVNPIEKLERSNLIVATTIHRQSATELVKVEHLQTVKEYSNQVFIATA